MKYIALYSILIFALISTFASAAGQSTLTVISGDMNGNVITGYYTVLYQGSSVVETGFSPATFTLNNSQNYTVQVQDYGTFVFDHWNDTGSTTRSKAVSISSSTQVVAIYRSTVGGVCTPGAVQSCAASCSGTSYCTGSTQTCSSAGQWGSCSAGSCSCTVGQCGVTSCKGTGQSSLTVSIRDPSNNALNGYYTVLYQNGAVVSTGFSPATFSLTNGQQYTVEPQDYGSYAFDHWGTGSTFRVRTISITNDTHINAYYNMPVNSTPPSDGITLPYYNAINQTLSKEQLQSDSSWSFNGSADGFDNLYDFYEDQNGLNIGVKADSDGAYKGFFIMNTIPIEATTFQSKITSPFRTIPDGYFQNGMYVQSLYDIIYVSCVAITNQFGTIWTVVSAKGGNNSADSFETLWIDTSSNQSLTRQCAIITNGNNYLRVYMDNELVYSNDTLNLGMESPFYAFLEAQTSYSGQMIYGTYKDFSINNSSINTGTDYAVNIATVDTKNNTINGLYTTLSKDGAQIKSGFSPQTFYASSGQTYQVAVSDYGPYEFDHWNDGTMNRFHDITVASNAISLQAVYRIV